MPHADAGPAGQRDYLYYRHALPVRLMHWINVVALTILLMSGLQIFNAHPALYWAGKSSYTGAPPVLEIGATAERRGRRDRHHARLRPRIRHDRRARRVEDRRRPAGGARRSRGGSTIPDNPWLSMARAWHFFFAWVLLINGLAYVAYSVGEPASRARPRARPATTGARSARRSATTCASAIRRARRRSATTCCRSSRISP